MKLIYYRSELLELIRKHGPSRACGREVANGNVEVYGGFQVPGELPRYIVRVTSDHREWCVHVTVNEEQRKYGIAWHETVDQVPWQWWAGNPDGRNAASGKLMNGDRPQAYGMLREQAKGVARERDQV